MVSQKISVVINTINEESLIGRALKSVSWVDEILVCDMHSTDKTVDIAKKHGAKIITHPFLNYVEPARNFAVSKASGEWILVLDADEEIPEYLAKTLKEIADKADSGGYIEIPRKNIIFGKWVKGSGWWPDYNIRFFKKGSVEWGTEIHRPPKTSGQCIKLPLQEECAILHHHYDGVSEFLVRMNRYTDIQSKELYETGYKFNWRDLIKKPLSEFLSRFFAGRGFEDGVHGLGLSLLQAFSFIIVYLKVWEKEKFSQQDLKLSEMELTCQEAGKEINFWFMQSGKAGFFKKFFRKAKNVSCQRH